MHIQTWLRLAYNLKSECISLKDLIQEFKYTMYTLKHSKVCLDFKQLFVKDA